MTKKFTLQSLLLSMAVGALLAVAFSWLEFVYSSGANSYDLSYSENRLRELPGQIEKAKSKQPKDFFKTDTSTWKKFEGEGISFLYPRNIKFKQKKGILNPESTLLIPDTSEFGDIIILPPIKFGALELYKWQSLMGENDFFALIDSLKFSK